MFTERTPSFIFGNTEQFCRAKAVETLASKFDGFTDDKILDLAALGVHWERLRI